MNNMSVAAVFGMFILLLAFVMEAIAWIIDNIGRDK